MVQPNIISGPPPRTELPENLCVGELIFNKIKSHGQNVSQVHWDTGESLTFAEVFERSRRLAVFLKKEGLKEGDQISICSENNLNFGIPFCAGLFIGVTICPLNPNYSLAELKHALQICKSKIIFVSPLALKVAKKITENLPWSPRLILLSDSSTDSDIPSICTMIASIQFSQAEEFRPTKVDNDNVVCIMCSSGTTGLPKGVQLTNKNILAIMKITTDLTIGMTGSGKVSLGLLPLFHAYALNLFLMWFVTGTKVIILTRFEGRSFLGAIEKYKIDILHLVPPLMVFLAKHPLVDQYDLSSVQIIWCGAAALSGQLEEAVKKRINVKNVLQAYGLTETTLTVLVEPMGATKVGSIGVLVPGASAKVLPIGDGNEGVGEPLGPNCSGELCFKGNMIMKGYCGDVSATSTMIDKEGWLHTGDIGYYDKDGYFYVVDRLKELIKYKGFQVPPAELEAILLTHSEIVDAAVIGLPDEEVGELPVAFVVKRPGSALQDKDIIKYLNDRISTEKWIRGGVYFVKEIPKTPSGKILRRELRNRLNSNI